MRIRLDEVHYELTHRYEVNSGACCIERFPADFMFQLTKEDCLWCQIGILNGKRGEHLQLEDAPKKRTCVSEGRFGESRTRRAHKRPRRIPERRGAIDFAAAKMGAEVIPGLLESIRKATTERRMNVANVIMLPFINSQFPVEVAA